MRIRLVKWIRSLSCFSAIGLLGGCSGVDGSGDQAGGTILPSEAIVSTAPADGATGISANTSITVTLTRAAVPDSLVGSIAPDIAFDVSWSADRMTLTVTAGTPFEDGAEYVVTITDLQFTDGRSHSEPFSFSFTVGEGDDTGGGDSGGGDTGGGGTITGDKMAVWTVGQTRLRGAVVHPLEGHNHQWREQRLTAGSR